MQAEIIEILENVAERQDQRTNSTTPAGSSMNLQGRGQERARNRPSNRSGRSVSYFLPRYSLIKVMESHLAFNPPPEATWLQVAAR